MVMPFPSGLPSLNSPSYFQPLKLPFVYLTIPIQLSQFQLNGFSILFAYFGEQSGKILIPQFNFRYFASPTKLSFIVFHTIEFPIFFVAL